MIYLTLYWSFVQIGLFSIGGGYAALPLIEHQVIEIHQWLTMSEFTDLLTISQMTPGPIALNASTFVGTKVGGLLGAIIATVGCVTPSCIIVMTLAYFYYKYNNLAVVKKVLDVLRPVVVALIGSAGLSIIVSAFWGEKVIGSLENINKIAVVLFLLGVGILRKFKLSPVTIIFVSGIVGVIIYSGII
ncbi:chromate transporter [Fusobacterium perfoetens]|uniref:chromate transporter n=1 Tax=Fusobacterium perfoetens TaxID=852 RepID=UPI000480B24D|nr:chromate transporter [Fusobacterium perfoetens]MCI6152080.1 chromate transporter [Fusobacterium perfoetens]MDY3238029.1 chromate transporter [Fusobacterium perfoetens]